jgi:two-component system LytT family response regulator
MIKVVLLDDEVHCTESLDIILKTLNIEVEVLAKFNDPELALKFIKQNQFDILFLDIEMPRMNGFELLSSLSQINFDVVFTTAYNQYAIKAFKFSAINYLLKPIDETELIDCLEAWKAKTSKQMPNGQLEFLLQAIQNNNQQSSKLALPTNYGLEFINIKEIVRCQSDSNYTNVYLVNGEKHLICRTLKEVENILQHHNFLRIHQSHLINPNHMKKFIRNDGGYLLMEDGEKISVSKNNKEKIIEIFSQIQRT